MLRKILILLALIILLLVTPAFAGVKTIETEGSCIISTNCSLQVAEEQALLDAKKRALEKAGIKLDNYAKILNGQVVQQEVINYATENVFLIEGSLRQNIRALDNDYQKLTVRGFFTLDVKKILTGMEKRGYFDITKKSIDKKVGFLGIQVKLITLYEDGTSRPLEIDGCSKGLFITRVFPDSPAETYGLKKNQIILKYNGHPIGRNFKIAEFIKAIEDTAPGDFMTFYIKSNTLETIEVCLAEKLYFK